MVMDASKNGDSHHQQTKGTLGTFGGVFTPSILTILGVIMYLRFGWVLANAGLGGTLLIVIICNTIAFITALSASAVATNSRLGVGGEYYLVSRSLGLTIGGTIGIPLFLCRTLSVTLYCFGLAEALAVYEALRSLTPFDEELAVRLRLDVDHARSHDEAGGVDAPPGGSVTQHTGRGHADDAVAGDAHVAVEPGIPRSVHDLAVADDEVVLDGTGSDAGGARRVRAGGGAERNREVECRAKRHVERLYVDV